MDSRCQLLSFEKRGMSKYSHTQASYWLRRFLRSRKGSRHLRKTLGIRIERFNYRESCSRNACSYAFTRDDIQNLWRLRVCFVESLRDVDTRALHSINLVNEDKLYTRMLLLLVRHEYSYKFLVVIYFQAWRNRTQLGVSAVAKG